MLEPNYVEILEICEEIEEEEHLEVLGPQIELDLSNPTIGEPLVEDARVAKPLHSPSKPLKDSLPNQPENLIDWLLKEL